MTIRIGILGTGNISGTHARAAREIADVQVAACWGRDMDGKLFTPHCVNSSSRTFDGDVWVRVEALVLGDSIIKHIANGDTVLMYTKPQMGGGMANNTKSGVLVEGKPLTEGYIALQAETAPIDFRKVEVLVLEGCTDPKAKNFKRYYVHSVPGAWNSALSSSTVTSTPASTPVLKTMPSAASCRMR